MRVPDEAIVLAGGLGTRLRGLIGDLPKPLAPVAGRPFLAWLLDALCAQRMRRIILATGYGADRVKAMFGARWQGVDLVYSREQEPRGTGGAIALAMRALKGDACFVLNGDTRVMLDYAAFHRCVCASGARLGVAISRQPDVSRYGGVRIDRGRITGFNEKGGSGPGFINAGVYWTDRSLLPVPTAAIGSSFETDIVAPAVEREAVVAFARTSDFIDIGAPEDYKRAQTQFLEGGVAP